jgi:hypothetical protein
VSFFHEIINMWKNKWGIEFADARSFFTLKETGQFIAQKTIVETQADTSFFSSRNIQLTNGTGVLTIEEQVTSQGIFRAHTFEAQTETLLLDFVSRFVFPKEWFERAMIHGQTIVHEDQNIYYQFPLDAEGDQIQFEGKDGGVLIRVLKHSAPISFVPHIYVRDEPGYWIAHIRFLPCSDKTIVTKLNYSFYNKAIPAIWNRLLLACGMKRVLLYRGEKKQPWSFLKKQWYRSLPLTSYRLGRLRTGEKICVTSLCELIK